MSATYSVSLFLSDARKQDADPTTENSKHLIKLLKKLTPTLSTIWKNTDGYAEQ